MVEFYNVGETQTTKIMPQNGGAAAKTDAGTNIVPMTNGKVADNNRGTSVQHQGGNPFYAETDFEHFDGLGSSGMTQADSATKRVKGELARLYNDVKRTNPEAVENLEFPPLPSVPAKGKKPLKLEAYLSALDQYRQTCEELLEGVAEQTVVDEVRGGTAAVIGEVRGGVQAVTNTVVEMGSANLAATLGVGEAMLNGLSEIYNKIDTDTHTILSAVNSNGQKILRAIDKQTGEIKQFIAEDGDKTRFQQFLNTLDIMDHTSWRIDSVHRHIDERGHWIEQKIDEAREDVNEYNRTQHEETREHISTEFEDHSLRSRLRRLFR